MEEGLMVEGAVPQMRQVDYTGCNEGGRGEEKGVEKRRKGCEGGKQGG